MQYMCLEAVEPCSLVYVPDHFKPEEMCNDDVEKDPYRLGDVPVRYRTAKLCQKIVKLYPGALMHVPDRLYYTPNHFKTQKMCDDVVQRHPCYLLGVPNYFVASQQIKIWRDNDYRDDEDVIRWYEGYQRRRPQGSHYWYMPE